MRPPPLTGSWALVTGASSGIGAELARQMARSGTNVVLTARSKERLEHLGADLSRVNGIQTRVVPADLSEASGITSLLEAVDALDLPIEHVVNNAGFGTAGPFSESDPSSERRMVRVNVEAVTAIAAHFVPKLVRRGGGGLINVASTAAFQPTPQMATYGGTKAFVLSFSLSLSEELRGSGVTVMALCPGPVSTGFQEAAGVEETHLFKVAKLDVKDVVERALAAYQRGEALYVPGALNQIQTTAVRFLPSTVVTRAANLTMRALGRRRST